MTKAGDWSNTPGCVALNEYMSADKKRTQRWLSQVLHVSQSAVSVWLKGRSRPATQYAVALSFLTSIPVEWWLTEEERMSLTSLPAEAQKALDALASAQARVRPVDPRQAALPFKDEKYNKFVDGVRYVDGGESPVEAVDADVIDYGRTSGVFGGDRVDDLVGHDAVTKLAAAESEP